MLKRIFYIMKKTNHSRFYFFYFLLLISLASCSVNKARIDNDLKSYYDSRKTEGCFTMLDNATGEITVYNMGMDTTRLSPGKSFEIFSSLVALHTGSIKNEEDSIVFKNSSDSLTGIKMTLKQVFHEGSDDFTKYVVATTGDETMQKWIDSLSYGNKLTGSEENIYWNSGKLAISPDEQLGLLKRLYFDQLPFRKSVQETVRKMMMQEDNSAYRFSYKTAPVTVAGGKTMTWNIGWIEENRHVYFFVNLVANDLSDKNPGGTAVDITRSILTHYGFFKGLK